MEAKNSQKESKPVFSNASPTNPTSGSSPTRQASVRSTVKRTSGQVDDTIIYAIALYDYRGATEEECDFDEGDVFELISRENQDWWWASWMTSMTCSCEGVGWPDCNLIESIGMSDSKMIKKLKATFHLPMSRLYRLMKYSDKKTSSTKKMKKTLTMKTMTMNTMKRTRSTARTIKMNIVIYLYQVWPEFELLPSFAYEAKYLVSFKSSSRWFESSGSSA